jgi:hypothetical protein
VLCSPVFRSSVPSSIPPRERGGDTAVFRHMTCGMLTAELVRRIGGSVPVGGRGSQGGSSRKSREFGSRGSAQRPG